MGLIQFKNGTIQFKGGTGSLQFKYQPLSYYDVGTEYVPWSLGMASTSGYGVIIEGASSVTIDSEALVGDVSDQISWATTNMVNLTDVTTLKITWSAVLSGNAGVTGTAYFVVGDSRTASRTIYTKITSHAGTFTSRTDSIDVSDLTGDYYLRVHSNSFLNGNSAVDYIITVTRVWGE